MDNQQTKLAVLIDADNTSASAVNDIMAEIATLGLALIIVWIRKLK